MAWLRWEENTLWAEEVPLPALVQRWGTPLYVYSAREIQAKVEDLKRVTASLPLKLFYAVKANSNGAILKLVRGQGLGAEVVSQGELSRALKAGFNPDQILFTGTGKTQSELKLAAEVGVHAIVVEDLRELQVLAGLPWRTAVALRVNLGLETKTHPYLTTSAVGTKFGLDLDGVTAALEQVRRAPRLSLVGLHTHLGSQLSQPTAYLSAVENLAKLAGELATLGFPLRFLDVGGGFALGFPFARLAEGLRGKVPVGLEIYVEPGRYVVAEAGCLITRVLSVKEVHGQRFAIVDAGMNDFLRPALYGAHHPLLAFPCREGEAMECTVAGPVCESSDVFGTYLLPPPEAGDILVFMNTGAYGFSMASTYNSRPRPAEVLVWHDRPFLMRERETLEDLVRGEVVPDCLN